MTTLERAPVTPEWSLFVDAVNAATDGYGAGTVNAVARAYVALPGRDHKARGRAYLREAQDAALTQGQEDRARLLATLWGELKGRGWKADPPARAAENAQKYRDLVTALQKAFGIAATSVPPELSEFFDEQGRWLSELPDDVGDAIVYRDWLVADPEARGPEPEVSEVDKRAARISLGRAPGAAGRPPVVRRVK